MKRVVNAATNGTDAAVDINEVQDRAAGNLAANDASNDISSSNAKGFDERIWVSIGTVGINGFPTMDSSIDWRDRVLTGTVIILSAANTRPGQANDYDFNAATAGTSANSFVGYTGTGAYGSLAGAAVDAANPPVKGSGVKTSYYVHVTTDIAIYADPTSGALLLYNKTSAKQLVVLVRATGDTGKR